MGWLARLHRCPPRFEDDGRRRQEGPPLVSAGTQSYSLPSRTAAYLGAVRWLDALVARRTPVSRTTTAILALLVAALSTGFALCMSIVHYKTWAFVPPLAFQKFQNASATQTVPLAIALGIPSLLLAAITAYRGLPGVAHLFGWRLSLPRSRGWQRLPY